MIREYWLNVLMRIASLLAIAPMFWAYHFFSTKPHDVLLTVVLLGAPYLFLACAPPKWLSVQVGLGVGYSVGVLILMYATALVGILGTSFGGPEPFPVLGSRLYESWNLALLPLALLNWLYHRTKIRNSAAGSAALLGLVYPFAATALHFMVNVALFRLYGDNPGIRW